MRAVTAKLAIGGFVIAGILVLPSAASAALSAGSMAALGDSLTTGQGAEGGVSASWSTGTSVNSHAQRLGIPLDKSYNVAAGGAQAKDLNDRPDRPGQAPRAVANRAEYVTIFMGTNDVCKVLTPVATFRGDIATAMSTLTSGLPNARVFVASIPNWRHLYDVTRDANGIAPGASSCPNFLSQTPNAEAEQHLKNLNGVLAQACVQPQCVFDGNAVYNHGFQLADYSAKDSFHFSKQGQLALADLTFPIAASGSTPPPQPRPPPPPPPPPSSLPSSQTASSPAPAEPMPSSSLSSQAPSSRPTLSGSSSPSDAATSSASRLPAKLKLKRASIRGGRLDALLGVTGLATGSMRVSYLAGGERTVFTVALDPAQEGEKNVKVLRTLTRSQLRARTGILSVSYRGDAQVRSDSVRARAANRHSALRHTQLSFGDARLVAGGTLKDQVDGVVRLRATYIRADGTLATWRQQVRVNEGRWAIEEQLPVAAAADPTAYLTIQFTGDLDARGGPYRGEQLGKGLGNLPSG